MTHTRIFVTIKFFIFIISFLPLSSANACPNWIKGKWYVIDDCVHYDGDQYIAIANNPGYIPSTSTWYWEKSNTIETNKKCSPWVQGHSYFVNDTVSYNGKNYIAILDNPGYVPETSTWYWREDSTACSTPHNTSTCTAWIKGHQYAVNDTVSYNGKNYIAILDNPGYVPETSTWYWREDSTVCTTPNNTNTCTAWVKGQQYTVNDTVSYNGKNYIAILDNPGYVPETSTWYWREDHAICKQQNGDPEYGDTGSGNDFSKQNPDANLITELVNLANQHASVDKIHNTIITYLVNNEFVGSQDMFQAIKGNHNPVNNPLYTLINDKLYIGIIDAQKTEINTYKIRSLDSQDKVLFQNIPNYDSNYTPTASFFVRDFLQVSQPSSGSTVTNKVSNLIIRDLIVNEQNGFVDRFNQYINALNSDARMTTHKSYPKFEKMAHRDAIQLVPSNNQQRYAGKILDNTDITNNIIYSDAALQGIFAGDGAFKNLRINNNYIQVNGKHVISISGMLSGSVAGNKNISGQFLSDEDIRLLPLRIGGGAANIMIVGFSNNVPDSDPLFYEYENISGINAASDLRRCGIKSKANNLTYYTNVNMKEFWRLYKANNYQGNNGLQMQQLMQQLANLNYAKKITDPLSLFKENSNLCK